jgi:hypothetical protein
MHTLTLHIYLFPSDNTPAEGGSWLDALTPLSRARLESLAAAATSQCPRCALMLHPSHVASHRLEHAAADKARAAIAAGGVSREWYPRADAWARGDADAWTGVAAGDRSFGTASCVILVFCVCVCCV